MAADARRVGNEVLDQACLHGGDQLIWVLLPNKKTDGADVKIQHVRAHTGHGMNERADELAAQGAQGLRRRDGAIYVPLDGPRLPADTVPD